MIHALPFRHNYPAMNHLRSPPTVLIRFQRNGLRTGSIGGAPSGATRIGTSGAPIPGNAVVVVVVFADAVGCGVGAEGGFVGFAVGCDVGDPGVAVVVVAVVVAVLAD